MKPLDEFADLLTLDPADVDIDAHGPRARATLERVLATDPQYDGVRSGTRRRRVRVAAAVSAVAVAAVAVIVPWDRGPAPVGDVAFATWTAQPGGLSANERAEAVKQCRKSLQGLPQDGLVKSMATAMVERRGDWALVILAGAHQSAATCMTNVNPRNRQGYGGIHGPGRAPVGPRQLAPAEMGISGGGRFGYLTSAIGRAGHDIVGMTYTSPTRGQVEASVQNGYYAFWLPGSEFDGLHPVPVRVTYRDGTTAAVSLGS